MKKIFSLNWLSQNLRKNVRILTYERHDMGSILKDLENSLPIFKH